VIDLDAWLSFSPRRRCSITRDLGVTVVTLFDGEAPCVTRMADAFDHAVERALKEYERQAIEARALTDADDLAFLEAQRRAG
jgi:hypothetical protein